MLSYPLINPVALQLGPIAIHWYGLMYLIGLGGAWALLTWRIHHKGLSFTTDQLSDILFVGALGIILGGRLGYMLFYAWPDLKANPLLLFAVWKGGMSFHGGLLGVIIALFCYAKKTGRSFLALTDFVAPVVPVGLAAGRIGNFINAELWGRVTDMPWGMVFPNAGDLPRHPSQLYEFLLEGIVLFLLLWMFARKPRPLGAISGLFLTGYGLFRFIVEFFREPDSQIGYLAWGWLTEGQLLSLPMMIIGLCMIAYAYRSAERCNNI